MLLLLIFLTGCSQLGYLAQAAKGQFEIINKQVPIDKILSDSSADSQTRVRLELVSQIRKFASNELDLPDNQSYKCYSELGRRYVVWNVVATRPYEMNPETSCFLVTGCLSYRGYFSESSAQAYEKHLISQGYDTYLYGVSAYSTLGWFADPVLDTFLYYPDDILASIIFHELAHQVVYVKDDSSFNEAFATAVEEAGVIRWIQQHGNEDWLERYRINNIRRERIVELILSYRDRLTSIYEKFPEAELAAGKNKILKELKRAYENLSLQGDGTPYYDYWFTLDINNAHLASVATYHRLVPAFRKIIAQSDSMAEFYATVSSKAILSADRRNSWINTVAGN